jgi:hypothetical protein
MAAKKKTETNEETAAAQAAQAETQDVSCHSESSEKSILNSKDSKMDSSPSVQNDMVLTEATQGTSASAPQVMPETTSGQSPAAELTPELKSVTDGVASVASFERQGGAEEALPPEHDSPPRARPEESPAPKLLTLSAAADLYRVPAWQSAALHKLMGWEPGKSVTVEEYAKALVRLKNRRIGG